MRDTFYRPTRKLVKWRNTGTDLPICSWENQSCALDCLVTVLVTIAVALKDKFISFAVCGSYVSRQVAFEIHRWGSKLNPPWTWSASTPIELTALRDNIRAILLDPKFIDEPVEINKDTSLDKALDKELFPPDLLNWSWVVKSQCLSGHPPTAESGVRSERGLGVVVGNDPGADLDIQGHIDRAVNSLLTWVLWLQVQRFESRARNLTLPCPSCSVDTSPQYLMTRPPPVLELGLEHQLVGVNWLLPYQVRWQGRIYRFASAVLYQPGHWSSRCFVNGHLYGGQILQDETRLGWEGSLVRLPDLTAQGWYSGPVASPVRIYFISNDWEEDKTYWNELSPPLPPQPIDTLAPSQPSQPALADEPPPVPPPASPQKRPCDSDAENECGSPKKKTRPGKRRARDDSGKFAKKS